MGVFDIGFRCSHGTLVKGQTTIAHPQVAKNTLMYCAHDRVLRKILPAQAGELSWQLGFSGPMYRGKYETPAWDTDPFAWGPRLDIGKFQGDWAREGGAPYTDVRNLFGYQRASIDPWEVVRDGTGAIVSTGWKSWTNQVTWDRHGDWMPEDWDEEKDGPYPQPSRWVNCAQYENQEQGWPWCYPRIRDEYEGGTAEEDYRGWYKYNEFGVDCVNCRGSNALQASHVPVGCAFVVLKTAGETDVVFAAARFTAPTFFRLGGTIICRYRGRFG